ncbi:Kinesin-like protein kif7 [Frankliniella fusca]|uniref:Kinesin-like protein kif7 n=1 Tax=Frankliniella fusca TaxID=407009 RepID=A0AAE1LSX3_9NEOP|nr:Kinesin-like protein kif7 [Frankliniella fusca]
MLPSWIRFSLPTVPMLPSWIRFSLPTVPMLPSWIRFSLPTVPMLPSWIRFSLPKVPMLPMLTKKGAGHFTLNQFEPSALPKGKLELRRDAKPKNVIPNATSPVERQFKPRVPFRDSMYSNVNQAFLVTFSSHLTATFHQHENSHVSFLLLEALALEEEQESRIKRYEAENLRLRLQSLIVFPKTIGDGEKNLSKRPSESP